LKLLQNALSKKLQSLKLYVRPSPETNMNAKVFISALEKNRSLKRLTILYLDDQNTAELMEALKYNAVSENLTLSECVFNSESFDGLVEFLGNSKALVSLDIANCVDVAFDNLKQLSKLLKTNASLLHLDVTCTSAESTEEC
jgi:hypothetical protein